MRGTFYGTTYYGGVLHCPMSCGVVYGIGNGTEKVLHRFKSDFDGAWPGADLIEVKGRLYGTTINGGASNCAGGCGTVYSISTSGKEQVLYRFTGGSDGANPYAGLIEMNGKLYGTTSAGGGSGCYNYGCGTVFSITTAGAENVLYRFKRSADGSQPAAGLIDVKGTLYGTTEYGGASGCDGSGCGTVYSISPTGAEKVLHRFNGHSGGAEPEANLIDVKGSLYGTTSTGGLDCYKPFSCGIVFALKKT